MSVHVDTAGDGPDLVLLHGWGMHGGVWGGVRNALAQKYRVHVVDLPGYGGSPSCAPYSLDEVARQVASVVPRAAVVCGWSLGGQVALRWALVAPQQVARLVLVATTPCFTRRTDWQYGMDAAVLNGFAADLQNDCLATLKRFLSLQAQGDAAGRPLLAELRRTLLDCVPPDRTALRAGLSLLQEIDMRGEVARIAQPVTVVHGARDVLAPLAAGRWLAEHMPHARLHVMASAAHVPFLSDAQSFLEVFDDV